MCQLNKARFIIFNLTQLFTFPIRLLLSINFIKQEQSINNVVDNAIDTIIQLDSEQVTIDINFSFHEITFNVIRDCIDRLKNRSSSDLNSLTFKITIY